MMQWEQAGEATVKLPGAFLGEAIRGNHLDCRATSRRVRIINPVQ